MTVIVHLTALLAPLTLAAGACAAQLTGPTACDWRARSGQMRRRLLTLQSRTPRGPFRAGLGVALLTSLLTSGTLAAYAAQPGAPEQLPASVIGVVGSGDQISLQLRADGATPARTLRPGDEFKDGWTLNALTPSVATLTKDGTIQSVGLNPTGALPAAAGGAPSTVTVVGAQAPADGAGASAAPATGVLKVIRGSEAADVVAERLAQWNGKPRQGLTVEETKRLITLNAQAIQALRDEGLAAGKSMTQANMATSSYAAQIAALGADGAAYDALTVKSFSAIYYSELDAYNRYGPVSITLPQGGDFEAATAAYPGAGWSTGPTNFPPPPGPTTWTLVKPNARMLNSPLSPVPGP